MRTSPWQPTSQFPSLAEGAVHLWLAHTETLAPCAHRFDALIDDQERRRGDAYLLAADRARHLTARGVLRALAGHYLAVAPADVRFGIGEFGKPYVASPPGAELSFNVSHSGEVVLLAFARDGDLGVDVQRWNARLGDAERERLAASVCSAGERATMAGLSPGEARQRAFYSIWSRKEAYLKATGAGISAGLVHVEVSADDTARLIADPREPMTVERWGMCDVDVGHGYSAALVCSARDRLVELRVASPGLFGDASIP